MSLQNEDQTKNITATFILEVLGRPPKHLVETLENLIKEIDNEKHTRVVGKKINEPVLMKGQKDFYTDFAEVEIETDDVLQLVILMFKYMPAHIEITYPEMIVLSNNGWNEILNEVTRRLHGYEEIARIMQVERGLLERKMKEKSEQQKNSNQKKANRKKKK